MVSPSTPVAELAAEWLEAVETELDPETVDGYKGYARAHWQPFFGSIGQVNAATVANYTRMRLGKVIRRTVQKELSALRGFLRWCEENRGVERVDVRAPAKKATGTADVRPHKLKALELSPKQVAAFIAALPELSPRGGWPVRARFEVAYETGLRPATLDALTVADLHGTSLQVREATDKARFGRDIPLTPRAATLLAKLAHGEPPHRKLFGVHDYRGVVATACIKAGLPRLSPYDMRHAFGTHRVESSGGNLPGVAYLMGHKQLTTTNKYAKPNMRAARSALGGHSGADVVRKEGLEPSQDVIPLEPERSAISANRSEVFKSVTKRLAIQRQPLADTGAAKSLLDALDSAVTGDAARTTENLARAAVLVMQAGAR